MESDQEPKNELPEFLPESLTAEKIEKSRTTPKAELNLAELTKWERVDRNAKIKKFIARNAMFFFGVCAFVVIACLVIWGAMAMFENVQTAPNSDLRILVLAVLFFGTFFMVWTIRKK